MPRTCVPLRLLDRVPPLGTGERPLVAGTGIFQHQSLGTKEELIGFQLTFTQAHRPVSTRSLHPATDGRRY
jgi:hypothetical protein